MRRVGKHMGGVLRATLLCGMGVQILLGLAWLIKNMGGLQNFQESILLLAGESAADGFYSGILYRGLAALLSSHLWILYGIQLAAAIAAAYGLMSCFLGSEKRVLRLFCALALTTVPQAMQCHLAVLPWSLGTSLMLGETALWRRAWDLQRSGNSAEGGRGEIERTSAGQDRRETGKASAERDVRMGGQDTAQRELEKLAVVMLLGWLLLLLVLPMYAWFVLPMLFCILWRMGKGRATGRLVCALAALALLFCNVTVNCGWNPAHWDRRLAADALSRTGWPYFQYTYEIFPQPLHDDIGLVTAREVSAYADGVERVLIPRLEEVYGASETTDRLWKLAGICLRDNLKADVKNIIWDMAAYHATPPILAMQLKGRAYDSYSGINYEQMRSRTPLLTRYYVTYGGRWWWVMLVLAAGIRGCVLCSSQREARRGAPDSPLAEGMCSPIQGDISGEGAGGTQKKDRGRIRGFLQCWMPVMAGLEWMILTFVLGGSGIMDYKKTLWVTVLWYAAVLWTPAGEEGSRKWQS